MILQLLLYIWVISSDLTSNSTTSSPMSRLKKQTESLRLFQIRTANTTLCENNEHLHIILNDGRHKERVECRSVRNDQTDEWFSEHPHNILIAGQMLILSKITVMMLKIQFMGLIELSVFSQENSKLLVVNIEQFPEDFVKTELFILICSQPFTMLLRRFCWPNCKLSICQVCRSALHSAKRGKHNSLTLFYSEFCDAVIVFADENHYF